MTHAVIIVGGSKEFDDEGKDFKRFIQEYGKATVTYIRAAYLSETELLQKLVKIVNLHRKEPLLLVYDGHGKEGGWEINGGSFLLYKLLAVILVSREQPTVVVTDCCYSGSLISYLNFFGADWEKIEVIASTDTKHMGVSGLLADVEEQWRKGVDFAPSFKVARGKVGDKYKNIRIWQVRYGAHLDHLFFTKH